MLACPNCGTEMIAQVDVCFICGMLLTVPPGERTCPACGKRYPADYADTFCTCGVELAAPPASNLEVNPPGSPALPKPPPGTRCLVLYGPDRKPVHYFPLTQDVTLIGRLDAVQGSFPDIDVDAFVDAGMARKVSRRHALVLHSRADDRFALRPLGGNTGTQIEADMVPAMADYPLTPGIHVILGGAVRFKFEVV
jgi:hypothetical protein